VATIGVEADGNIDPALLEQLTADDGLPGDDAIPPAHKPVVTVSEPSPPTASAGDAAGATGAVDGLLAAFRRVFDESSGSSRDTAGGPASGDVTGGALADAGNAAVGVRR